MIAMRFWSSWASGCSSVMFSSSGAAERGRFVGYGEHDVEPRLLDFTAGHLRAEHAEPDLFEQTADAGRRKTLMQLAVWRRDLGLLVLIEAQQAEFAAGAQHP